MEEVQGDPPNTPKPNPPEAMSHNPLCHNLIGNRGSSNKRFSGSELRRTGIRSMDFILRGDDEELDIGVVNDNPAPQQKRVAETQATKETVKKPETRKMGTRTVKKPFMCMTKNKPRRRPPLPRSER